jgi:hypothetical protein
MNLFTKIAAVHADTSGWCSELKANTLAAIVLASRPEISVEIGVWYGRSLLPVALAHQSVGKGKVYAVDPWYAGCSVAGQVNPEDAAWWKRQDIHETALAAFLLKVESNGLKDFVSVHRMHSDEFDPPEGIGNLHIDGNHGEQAIKDFQKYAPKVKVGGFLTVDDINWTGGSVLKGTEMLPEMGFEELYKIQNKSENWAVFQRCKRR